MASLRVINSELSLGGKCRFEAVAASSPQVSLLGSKVHNIKRTIKEAIYIRVNDPSLNRNINMFHLSHIWDEVMFNTLALHLK